MDFVNDLIPHYAPADLDRVGEQFLAEFYPAALETPMPVPIKEIATKVLGLAVKHRRLTEDFSVYGQTCFNSGFTCIWDAKEQEYRDFKVRKGTIIIDPDTLKRRNIGCVNNTLAHECVHWWKHKDYHLLQSEIDKYVKTHKCSAIAKAKAYEQCKTDEDWMEWQATNIAPRILMPAHMFEVKFNEIYCNQPRWAVVKELAEFFVVSKESAGIRLSELGLL